MPSDRLLQPRVPEGALEGAQGGVQAPPSSEVKTNAVFCRLRAARCGVGSNQCPAVPSPPPSAAGSPAPATLPGRPPRAGPAALPTAVGPVSLPAWMPSVPGAAPAAHPTRASVPTVCLTSHSRYNAEDASFAQANGRCSYYIYISYLSTFYIL